MEWEIGGDYSGFYICEEPPSLKGGTYWSPQREKSGFSVSTAKMPESDLHCVRGQISTGLVDTVLILSWSLYKLSTHIFSPILIRQILCVATLCPPKHPSSIYPEVLFLTFSSAFKFSIFWTFCPLMDTATVESCILITPPPPKRMGVQNSVLNIGTHQPLRSVYKLREPQPVANNLLPGARCQTDLEKAWSERLVFQKQFLHLGV